MVGSEKGKLKKEEVNAVGGNEPAGTKPGYASLGLTKPLAEGGKDGAPAAPFNAFAGNGIVGRFGPVGDKASLSLSEPTKPLNGGASAPVGDGAANVSVVQNAPTFQKDDTKNDGGFFGWLGGLIKKRPGIRSGESADEYDERMTRNKMRLATLADAIRHMGNIYYTSKGAPLQRFNSPVEGLQKGLQQRKNERARQAALEAYRAYKAMDIELKQKAGERADKAAKAMDDYRKGMLGIQEGNLKLAGERLGETKRHNKAQEGLSASRLALARVKAARTAGGSGSGSSGGVGGGYGYATPYGRLASKKQLTPQQEAQAWEEMRNLGMITPQKQRELDLAMNGYTTSDGTVVRPNATQARKIIQGAISYGLLDSSGKGESLRKTFRDGFGYTDVRTSATAQRGVNTSGKKKVRNVTKTVSKSQAKQIREQRKGANPIRWQGSGSKPKPQSKPTNKGRGTDWSKFVK
jgi:hypothetical protein